MHVTVSKKSIYVQNDIVHSVSMCYTVTCYSLYILEASDDLTAEM